MKMNKLYAVYDANNAMIIESPEHYYTDGICLVCVDKALVFPLNLFQVEVLDEFNYSINGTVYPKEWMQPCTEEYAAQLMAAHTVIRLDDEGTKVPSSTDEVCKDVISLLPDINKYNFGTFTKCVITALKTDGKIIPIDKDTHSKRTKLIGKLAADYGSGDKELTPVKAALLLNSCGLTLEDVLNKKYI